MEARAKERLVENARVYGFGPSGRAWINPKQKWEKRLTMVPNGEM